jgi:hypothetical protein|tara:strand:+ start:165 stop:626 length:462 start_codon:yes stop_codon:yes gene_type:complete
MKRLWLILTSKNINNVFRQIINWTIIALIFAVFWSFYESYMNFFANTLNMNGVLMLLPFFLYFGLFGATVLSIIEKLESPINRLFTLITKSFTHNNISKFSKVVFNLNNVQKIGFILLVLGVILMFWSEFESVLGILMLIGGILALILFKDNN